MGKGLSASRHAGMCRSGRSAESMSDNGPLRFASAAPVYVAVVSRAADFPCKFLMKQLFVRCSQPCRYLAARGH